MMDDVDRKIISQLQLDGRATLERLAESVGFTGMGVKKRLRKLMGQNAIRVSASLNPFFFKLFPAIVLLEMESGEAVQRLVERFRDCPRVVYIFKTIGGFNLVALVVAEDRDTLESISVEKCSLRSSAGIRRSEFYPIGDVYFSPFLPVREFLAHKGRRVAPCDVDCESCVRYVNGRCVGCPSTVYYRGSL